MRLLLLYCYYNYTLSYKNYQTLSFLFQDSEKFEGLYEKELNLEPLILYLCRLYDCFAIFIRRLKQSPRLDINCCRNLYPPTKKGHWTIGYCLRNSYLPTKTIHWF